jgi:cytochrome d ubiquinol oxidase subunit I
MGDVLNLARWQFAVTTVYHFFFVPLTIGLAFLITFMESLYVKTKDEKYKQMVKYWGHLFLINFAMGVATGIVQEFQFGMNWSNYSKFVGDIFGVPLAIEALLAFFLESTFLGIWVFGWDKVSKKIHLLSIWIVSIGTIISAFFILTANSFMHEPVGYTLRNGRAELVSFSAVLQNPHLWVQFPHTIFAALSTGGFFILGISAYHMAKKNREPWVKSSLKIGIFSALIATVLVAGTGDLQGKYLVKHLPMKMAAAEAIWDSKDPDPLGVVAIINEKDHKNTFEVSIPKLLSFMSYNSFSGKVQGLNDIQAQYEKQYGPGNYIPPVTISFYSFRLMVGAGMAMILLSLVSLYLMRGDKIYSQNKLLRLLTISIALPYISNSAGWILTEISRSPWIVFGLLKLKNGVSPTVSGSYILTSLIVFTVVYTILMVIDIKLMIKFVKQAPSKEFIDNSTNKNSKEGSLWI